MTRRNRFASVCGLAFATIAPMGCSSETSVAPTIEGKTPADYRDEMEKKIGRPLGDPPPKAKKSGGRRRAQAIPPSGPASTSFAQIGRPGRPSYFDPVFERIPT